MVHKSFIKKRNLPIILNNFFLILQINTIHVKLTIFVYNTQILEMKYTSFQEYINISNESLRLSELFYHFHSQNIEDISVSESDFNIILPYLFFNPDKLNLYREKVSANRLYLYRLKKMREIIDSDLDQNIKISKSFEECKDNFSRLMIIKECLVSESNDSMDVFNLTQYQQYFADVITVLFPKYGKERISNFVMAALRCGETAVLELCFAFPIFIIPIFRAINMNLPPFGLIIKLVTLSKNHRGILLSSLARFHELYIAMALKLFQENSALLIIDSLPFVGKDVIANIKEELYGFRKIEKLSPKYYTVYAQCCGQLTTITDDDVDVLMKAQDDDLLISLLFVIDNANPKVFDGFIRKFQKSPNSLCTMFSFVSDKIKKNNERLLKRIKKSLGIFMNWEIRSTFSNHLFKEHIEDYIDKFDFNSFPDKNSALYIVSTLIKYISNRVIDLLPNIIPKLTYLDSYSFDAIVDIVSNLWDTYKDKNEFANIIYNLINLQIIQDVQGMMKNPIPAISYTIFLLAAEEKLFSSKMLIQTYLIEMVPFRFIYYCALNSKSANEIFVRFSKLIYINKTFFVKTTLSTMEPSFFLPYLDNSPGNFLNEFFKNPLEVNQESHDEWLVYHFIGNVNFVFNTIKALGGPFSIGKVHELLNFPYKYYHNKYLLDVIIRCIIDILSYLNANDTVSIMGLASMTFNLLKDKNIDKEIIKDFLKFIISLAPDDIIKGIINDGLDRSILPEISDIFSNYLNFTVMICKNITVSNTKFLIIFEFLSYILQSEKAKHDKTTRSLYCELLSMEQLIKSSDEHSIMIILDSIFRIFCAFPTLSIKIDNTLCKINDVMKSKSIDCDSLIEETRSKIQLHLLT